MRLAFQLSDRLQSIAGSRNAVRRSQHASIPIFVQHPALIRMTEHAPCACLHFVPQARMYPSAATLWQHQDEVKPHMRHVLLRWLLDVCRQYCWARETFLLAVNYVDR